jgi:hypothetical protein
MFRSIMKAIGAALRAAARALRGLLRLLGQILGYILGLPPDFDDIPTPAPMEDLDDVAGPEVSRHEYYAKAASDVLGWCADSLIDDKPAPLPPGLPVEVSWWLPGLTRDEAEVILNSDRDAISLHLQEICEISGVRAVQRLTPASWPASPRREPAEALVVSCEPAGSDAPAPLSAPTAGR